MGNAQLTHGTLKVIRNPSNDDADFFDWLGSVSATQAELQTLSGDPSLTLNQAKERVRQEKVNRVGNGVLKVVR